MYQTSEDGRERVLNTLGPGEIFGELGLLDESPRSATVTTLEPTEVLAITSKDVRAVVKEEPEVLWKIVEALCERIRELTTEALDMSFRSVPYRVLRMLIQATTKHGQPTDAGTRVTIDAKHLASQVNCGVDQATSILGRFAERGLLLVMEGHLLVPDPKALTRALEYEDSASAWKRAGEPRRVFFLALFFVVVTLLGASVALAHERFVRHNLRYPLHYEFFGRWPGGFLGLQPDMVKIATRVAAVLAAFFLVWLVRRPVTELIERRLVRAGGRTQRGLHTLACFLTDRPVRGRVFHALGQWAVIAFLRSPGLVLMYAATNDSLVMPSFPLDPASAQIFKFLQVALGLLILTQTWLPLCGAMVFGTWLYLFRWGWMVAVDAVPVLTVAVVYISSPWQSHKLPITKINAEQMRWVRFVLGIGFFALGWLKVYNHNLVAGVADNAPSILKDPMIGFFTSGTNPYYRRECWVIGFGLAEVMSGFMVTVGVFTRIWGAIMAFMFTKLLLLDFGWDEIPHLYPICALLTVIFSNQLTSEADPIEALDEAAWRAGHRVRRVALVGGSAALGAFLVIFPLLYFISFFDRSAL